MVEEFTNLALLAIDRAGIEARKLAHHHLGPEDLLLGLMCVGNGVGARVLASMACTVPGARAWVEATLGKGTRPGPMTPEFTPEVQRVIERGGREATELGQDRIGTGHLLLGIIEEGDGGVMQVLHAMHVNFDRVRQLVRMDPIDPEHEQRIPTQIELDSRLTKVETAIANVLERLAALEHPGTD